MPPLAEHTPTRSPGLGSGVAASPIKGEARVSSPSMGEVGAKRREGVKPSLALSHLIPETVA
jgi:hypothetical protein